MNAVVPAAALAAILIAPGLSAQARWTLVQDLRIGSVNRAADALTEVADIAVSPTGTLYVAHPQEHRIRVFDARGRPVRTIGREGSGPGEFRGLAFLGWRADTLYAVDAAQQRLSLFAADGRHLRTFGVAAGPLEGRFRPPVPRALLADGSLVAQPPVPSGPVANGAVTDVPVVRMDRQGRVLATLDRLSWAGASGAVMGQNRVELFRQPITGTGLYAPAWNGNGVVFVHRSVPSGPEPSTFRVRLVSGGGQVIFSRGYAYTPVRVPRRVADSLSEQHVARLVERGMPRPQAERAGLRALSIPDFQPPVSAVVAGRDGTIWLRREDAGARDVQWLVLGPDGAILATLSTPARLRVLEADRNNVWAVMLDELDVPYVVRYAVRPG